MSNTNDESDERQQARAQCDAIVARMAAVQFDRDRLEELTDERAALVSDVADAQDEHDELDDDELDRVATDAALRDARAALAEWDEENGEELRDLQAIADEYGDADGARDAAMDAVLEVAVRSDWVAPGEELRPAEFFLLLCTGGPAVRLRGELDVHGEPDRVWLEYQGWGTPWREYTPAQSHRAELLAFASLFFAG